MVRPASLPTMYEEDDDVSVGSAPPPPPADMNNADGLFDEDSTAVVGAKMTPKRKQLLTGLLAVLMVVVGALAINLAVNDGNKNSVPSAATSASSSMSFGNKGASSVTEASASSAVTSSSSEAAIESDAVEEQVNTANQLSGTSGSDDDWLGDDDSGSDDDSGCTVTITTNDSCYGKGETIHVDYSTCDVGGGWVALYHASAESDGELTSDYIDWDWASGSGSTWFRISRSGAYKVYIMAGDDWDGGYIASTDTFRVSSDCHSDGGMPAGHSYDKPVPAPTRAPCEASIEVEGCFSAGELIDIDFKSCGGSGDWVGLYRLGSREYTYWEYTCGGQDGPCHPSPDSGTLNMPSDIRPGQYRAHLYDGSDNLQSRSGVFRVATDCNTDGGMPAGHSYPDKPVTPPTRPPQPEPTPEPTPEPQVVPTPPPPTPEPTPKPTPPPTRPPTPFPTRETPEPTPQPTPPPPTPEPQVVPTPPPPTPEPTPQPTPEPQVVPTPPPPTPEPPTPEPTPLPTPEPTPMPTPEPQVVPTPPPPTPEPTPQPTPEPQVVPTPPPPTPRPSPPPPPPLTPEPTPQPTPEPQVVPTPPPPTPEPTPQPTPFPTPATPRPTPEPQVIVTPEPTPAPTTPAPTVCVENPNQIDWCESGFLPSNELQDPNTEPGVGWCNPCLSYVLEQYSLCSSQWDMWCYSAYMWCCPGATEACPDSTVPSCLNTQQLDDDCVEIAQIAAANGDTTFQISQNKPGRDDRECPAWMTPPSDSP